MAEIYLGSSNYYCVVSIKPNNASEKDFLVENIFSSRTDPFRQHNQKEGDGG